MTRPEAFMRLARRAAPLPLLALAGCSDQHFWLLNPRGLIASTELHYLILDVLVMLIVIVPVTALTVWMLWRYRAKARAAYDPNWTHSNLLEVIVWSVPLAIVGALSYYSYQGVHAVNPYAPQVLARASRAEAKPTSAQPLEVDVIATDWQWLFVYPEQHVASANELVVPTHVPVHFRLTSATVLNDFFIPQLVGQIYAMPGMRTKQAMLVERAGEYHGIAQTLSGPGFSWMNFKVQALDAHRFAQWVHTVRHARERLNYATFAKFARPTVNTTGKPKYFANVEKGLFTYVIRQARAGKVYPTPYAFSEDMRSSRFLDHTN